MHDVMGSLRYRVISAHREQALLDREVGRLRATQDSVNEVGASAVLLGLCGRVGKQCSSETLDATVAAATT